MYEAFYQLSADPFRTRPEEQFFFAHHSYARAKAYLQYALLRGDGIAMLTGAAGTGKTTLCNDLAASLRPREVVACQLIGAEMRADDFLRAVGYTLELDVVGTDKATLMQRLRAFLSEKAAGSERPVLIVDEAQELDNAALNEVRLLDNLRTDGKPLVQILLVGNHQLRQRLISPHLTQVHQRLVAACHLEPLSSEETSAYVQFRLHSADWQGNPKLSDGALTAIHQHAFGVPRRINLICSRLLLHGSLEEKPLLDGQDVQLVVEALRHEGLMNWGKGDDGDAGIDAIEEILGAMGNEGHSPWATREPFLSDPRRSTRSPLVDASARQVAEDLSPTLSEMVATRPSTNKPPQRRKRLLVPRQGVRASVLLLAVAIVVMVTYLLDPHFMDFPRTALHGWVPERFLQQDPGSSRTGSQHGNLSLQD